MQNIGLLFPCPSETAGLVVGGITMLERQARQLRRAGAGALLLVDPEPLSHIPAGAIPVKASALAEHVAAADGVLAIAPGLVIDDRAIAAIAAADAPALLVSDGTRADAAMVERLDATTMAVGVMRLPGRMVRDASAGIGEWDLHSTLIRIAAADPRTTRLPIADLPLYDPARRRDVAMAWAMPGDAAAAAAATRTLILASQKGCLDWPARFLHPWPENLLVQLLAPTRITPNMVTLFTGIIGIIAGICFATGALWWGLGLALITGPLDGVDGKLARTRVEYSRWGDLEHLVDKLLEYGWYLCIAWHFFVTSGSYLPWALAAFIILPAIAEAVQGEFFRRMTGAQLDDAGDFERRLRLVAGRRNTFLWSWLIFAAFGQWFAGFVMLACYSVLTTGLAQWRFYKRLSAYGRVHGATIAANYRATGYAFLPSDKL